MRPLLAILVLLAAWALCAPPARAQAPASPGQPQAEPEAPLDVGAVIRYWVRKKDDAEREAAVSAGQAFAAQAQVAELRREIAALRAQLPAPPPPKQPAQFGK